MFALVLTDLLKPTELVGIFAGLFVLASFLFKGELKIRVVNSIGALLFIIYGSLIGSLPVTLINFSLLIVQVVTILKESRREKYEVK